jgi:hypothetical protein
LERKKQHKRRRMGAKLDTISSGVTHSEKHHQNNNNEQPASHQPETKTEIFYVSYVLSGPWLSFPKRAIAMETVN